jgi:hypothetical protein
MSSETTEEFIFSIVSIWCQLVFTRTAHKDLEVEWRLAASGTFSSKSGLAHRPPLLPSVTAPKPGRRCGVLPTTRAASSPDRIRIRESGTDFSVPSRVGHPKCTKTSAAFLCLIPTVVNTPDISEVGFRLTGYWF